MNIGWAIVGIIIVATVYEINARAGIALFLLVIMAMVYRYGMKYGFSSETTR
jgi:hypothetical protein